VVSISATATLRQLALESTVEVNLIRVEEGSTDDDGVMEVRGMPCFLSFSLS
jgi:hypothetical protein